MQTIIKGLAALAAVTAIFAAGYLTGGGSAPISPAAGGTADPAHPLDQGGPSGDARMRAIVEQYIKENPKVILDAVNDYQRFGYLREIAARAEPYRDTLEDTARGPVMGDPAATVKIIEFFDYRCPHCRTNYPVIERILNEDPSVVLVPKLLPILGDGGEDDMSRFAAKAALAAHAQNKFGIMHKSLMESDIPISRNSVMAIARDIGLNMDQFKADMESDDVRETLAETFSLAEDTGFLRAGTPGYLIGGEVVIGAGADAYDRLRGMIDRAKAEQSGR